MDEEIRDRIGVSHTPVDHLIPGLALLKLSLLGTVSILAVKLPLLQNKLGTLMLRLSLTLLLFQLVLSGFQVRGNRFVHVDHIQELAESLQTHEVKGKATKAERARRFRALFVFAISTAHFMRKKSSFTSTISQEWSIILYNTSGLHQEVMKVRKKGKEIIRPVGVEIREYLNDGWFLSIIRFAKSANLLTKFRDKEKEPRLFQDSPPF